MQKFLSLIGAVCALGYLAACLALFVFQRSMIYYPPAAAALRAPQVSTLDVPGAMIRVAERSHPGPQAVLYFGGNAEDVSVSLPQLSQAFPDRALYLPHYRGYAGSTGKPNEQALIADALALYDRVAALQPHILVIGRSLGTGVAIQVASRRKVDGLVLVTPFDSLRELAARQFPYFPVRWMLRDTYESWRYAPNITAPTLIIAAQHDDIIPRASTERLLAQFRQGVASMEIVEKAGHNSISGQPAYGLLLQAAGKYCAKKTPPMPPMPLN
jgi:pimeloyl-ACP methyl ester carboxylesterase